MNSERIQLQHMEEQLWQQLRDYREDIERVACDGPESGYHEPLVKGVFNYVLARMEIADFDLEES